jgi:hypothetical protein
VRLAGADFSSEVPLRSSCHSPLRSDHRQGSGSRPQSTAEPQVDSSTSASTTLAARTNSPILALRLVPHLWRPRTFTCGLRNSKSILAGAVLEFLDDLASQRIALRALRARHTSVPRRTVSVRVLPGVSFPVTDEFALCRGTFLDLICDARSANPRLNCIAASPAHINWLSRKHRQPTLGAGLQRLIG